MKRITTCVGIDLARRAKHKALVVGADDCAGTNRALSFSHDLEGLTALSAYLRARTGRSTLEGLAVNMEPTSGAFEPVSMNASTMPGSAAWLTASPRRLCRRSTANAPSMPATIPMAAEPRATVRRV